MMRLPFFTLALVILSCAGCASVDAGKSRASSEIPESARVDELYIPYDESLPHFALIVEPVRFEGATTVTRSHEVTQKKANQNITLQQPVRAVPGSAQHPQTAPRRDDEQLIDKLPNSNPAQVTPVGMTKSTAATQKTTASAATSMTSEQKYEAATTSYYVDRESQRIAAQLTSSLSGVKNFRLVDARYAAARGVNIKGAKGPYLIRAAVTEFAAESEGTKEKLNLFAIYSSNSKLSRGVVALDVSIIDAQNGEIISSFPVRGSFGEEEQRRGVGLIAKVVETEASAKSMMTQATRVAANEAAKKALETLAELNRR